MGKNYSFGRSGPTWRGLPMVCTGGRDISGVAYFVDANVSATGDGSSWDSPYQTIAEGLAASQAQVTNSANRAWARRNTVYYCGDYISESLTDSAQQTDLIGVGSDTGSQPRLVGTQTLATARSSFRIINMQFVASSTSPIISFPTAMHGWELHYVTLLKHTSYLCSAHLQSTDARNFVMNNVRILPDNGAAMSTIGFNIAGTTNGIGLAQIYDCEIHGVEGLNVVDTSAYYEGATCKNTLIRATNLCIDDNSDTIAFINCRLITAAASGSAAGSGIVDWNANLAAGNYAHSSDGDGPLPDLNAHG